MNAALLVFLVLSVLANAGLLFLVVRSAKRLLQFDDLFELLTHDIETNVDHLDKLSETPLLTHAPEVKTAHLNMQIMNVRLKEYVLQMESLAARRLRSKQPTPPPNPPKVV